MPDVSRRRTQGYSCFLGLYREEKQKTGFLGTSPKGPHPVSEGAILMTTLHDKVSSSKHHHNGAGVSIYRLEGMQTLCPSLTIFLI